MASLHKDPRGKSPYWYCAYTLPNGKRRFRSTKQTDRSKAEEFRLGLARSAAVASKGDLTEERARELISEIVEHASGEPLKFSTAEEWLQDWLQAKQVSKSNGTFLKYRHTIEGFLLLLGPRAKRNLNQVNPGDIQRFRDSLVKEGKHPSTCNFAVKHLRIPFNLARRQGLIVHNPAEAIEMLPTDPDSTKRPFDPEQVVALLKAAPSVDWRGVILIAFYTGARLRDAANLRWPSIDLEKKVISFRAAKTGKPVVIPMHETLRKFLRRRPRANSPKAPIFPSLAGKSAGGKSGLSEAFKRIMAKANVAGEIARQRTGASGRAVNTLSFHSLRHSFNSIMANAGVPQEIRQKLTGHLDADVNTRYTHHQIEPLRAAIAVIPSIRTDAS